MSDGITWDATPVELSAPRAEIRRVDRGDLAIEALDDAYYLEISPADQYDGLMAHCRQVMSGG